MTLWRQLDRLAPRAAIGPAVFAHLARWSLVLGVAVAAAALFGAFALRPAALVGSVLTNTLLLTVCGLTLAFFRPTLYASFRSVTLVAGIFLVVLALAAIAARDSGPVPSSCRSRWPPCSSASSSTRESASSRRWCWLR